MARPRLPAGHSKGELMWKKIVELLVDVIRWQIERHRKNVPIKNGPTRLSITPRRMAEFAIDMLKCYEAPLSWQTIRWKTLYTMSPYAKLAHKYSEEELPESLLGGLRGEADALVGDMTRGWWSRCLAKNRYRKWKCSGMSVLERLPELGIDPINDARSFAEDELERPNRSLAVDIEVLTRIFFCEIVLYSVSHTSGALLAYLKIDKKSFQAMCRDLLFVNALRNIDGFADSTTLLSKDTAREFMGFANAQTLDCLPREFEYLRRWPQRMQVIVASDDVTAVAGLHEGPFENVRPENKQRYEDSYIHFLTGAPARGFDLLLANYEDLRPDQVGGEIHAWKYENDRWAMNRARVEFLYDKFPKTQNTIPLKNAIRDNPKVRAWNPVTFTLNAADKKGVDDFLRKNGFATVGPTFGISKDPNELADGLRRPEILDRLKAEYNNQGYVWKKNEPCLVAKPRDFYGGMVSNVLLQKSFWLICQMTK